MVVWDQHSTGGREIKLACRPAHINTHSLNSALMVRHLRGILRSTLLLGVLATLENIIDVI